MDTNKVSNLFSHNIRDIIICRDIFEKNYLKVQDDLW